MLQLSQIPEVTEVPNFSEEAKSYLQEVIDEFSISDATEIKNIEKVTNHDVKAVEYFLKQKCQSNAEVAKVALLFLCPFCHWNCALISVRHHEFCWFTVAFLYILTLILFLLQVLEFFHFACTSEDINNLAHAMMLKEAMHDVIFPVMDELIKAICNMARDNAHIPMLSRTHGQVGYFVLNLVMKFSCLLRF